MNVDDFGMVNGLVDTLEASPDRFEWVWIWSVIRFLILPVLRLLVFAPFATGLSGAGGVDDVLAEVVHIRLAPAGPSRLTGRLHRAGAHESSTRTGGLADTQFARGVDDHLDARWIDSQFLDRHLLFLSGTPTPGAFGSKLEQRSERVPGPRRHPGLKPMPHADEGQDPGRFHEIDMTRESRGQRPDAEAERGRGADLPEVSRAAVPVDAVSLHGRA